MGYLRNISPEDHALLQRIRADEKYAKWRSSLKANTIRSYESGFFQVLKRLRLMPTELLEKVDKDPRTVSTDIKVLFAALEKEYAYAARNIQLAAFKNFIRLYELDLPLIGFRLSGFNGRKPTLTWSDAERIISLANAEYQPMFRFMLSSALDPERFVLLNQDENRIKEIKAQLRDETRDWIRIEIPKGRKNSPSFFVMVPRKIAELLPILDQEGKPVKSKQVMAYQWVIARNRAGFIGEKWKGVGAHRLRSVWTTEASRRKLDPILVEFQMGHNQRGSSGPYQRAYDDEAWVLQEFRRAWQNGGQAASKQEMQNLAKENEELRERLKKLESQSTREAVQEEVRRILKEQYPQLVKELAKEA